MSHLGSVFANSCVRVPVDPISKMPKTAYERKTKTIFDQCSVESSCSGLSIPVDDVEAGKFKEFYQSIPDYNDLNHLPADEFYSTLKLLREKKKKMFNRAVHDIAEDIDSIKRCDSAQLYDDNITTDVTNKCKIRAKRKPNLNSATKSSELKNVIDSDYLIVNKIDHEHSLPKNKDLISEIGNKDDDLEGIVKTSKASLEKISNKKDPKTKRNHSACSISWSDLCKIEKDEVDTKFDKFFEGKKYNSLDRREHRTSQSMPSSPIRTKSILSPILRRRKSITVPKPFKMTERDDDDRIKNELRTMQKSFSEEMLHKKVERKQFKARPVPIESRIPLYDKILEDQAMRRAIAKINSEAELRAVMKPFSFTKREESGSRPATCERATHLAPKPKKKKRFKARPVPKTLFSNYIYDKMKEDEFFRNLNRRIRAEEVLRRSALPGSMAARESRLSTPAAHSDLPRDPSPLIHSTTPSDLPRTRSPTKDKRRGRKGSKDEFITTSPQPFRFNTADRAAKKMLEATKKILYQFEPKDSTSGIDSGRAGVYSALELRAHSSGRSNLAALLRVENVKRRFDIEASRRTAEQRRHDEMRTRDRLLRAKPAWRLVKNNHEEDIAMRLQTRRDEERMRREEFLHEMELMYGRVMEQPMLFERYYAPRSRSAPSDSIQLSPRKGMKKRNFRTKNTYRLNTPRRSHKVSINDTADMFNGSAEYYATDNKLYSDSEIVTDSLDGTTNVTKF